MAFTISIVMILLGSVIVCGNKMSDTSSSIDTGSICETNDMQEDGNTDGRNESDIDTLEDPRPKEKRKRCAMFEGSPESQADNG